MKAITRLRPLFWLIACLCLWLSVGALAGFITYALPFVELAWYCRQAAITSGAICPGPGPAALVVIYGTLLIDGIILWRVVAFCRGWRSWLTAQGSTGR